MQVDGERKNDILVESHISKEVEAKVKLKKR
jgi:hypothetical protein